MSFKINWDALTNGPEGDALAETIRAFIHERFQQIELPKLIRSVKVHAFDFGTISPEIVLKDVCDPLPDFYGDEEDEPESGPISPHDHLNGEPSRPATYAGSATADIRGRASTRPTLNTTFPPTSIMRSTLTSPNPSTMFPRSFTPAIPGGTSNMSYFHLPLNASLSGAATPLAAVAGGHFGAWPDFHHTQNHFHHDHAMPTQRRQSHHQPSSSLDGPNADLQSLSDRADDEKSVEDVQIVARLKYSGDIKLSLTAEILLDYPMPSFVGIPVKLNVTGMTFDGVAVVAYIKSKAHFCFLAPEDADALVGSDDDGVEDQLGVDEEGARRVHLGGLFEEIKVESEIGQKVNGKQVLKNVGRVEKFVLEQVRRIFEQEFVYPCFWTFLV
jgi:distribution and morphology protein 12